MTATYIFRVRFTHGQHDLGREGQMCRVLARGKLNSALVEFEDGFRMVTSRNYLRRPPQKQNPA